MPNKSAKTPLAARNAVQKRPQLTLAIDIGGAGLKALLLDESGQPIGVRRRVPTPAVPTARACLRALDELAAQLPGFDRVSVGYPGVIREGVTCSAANLHPTWIGFPLAEELSRRWGKPVRVGNDADVQGYGAIEGHGAEMVITLGTGMGAALFVRGRLYPNLELGHHPWKSKTYEDYLGRRGYNKYGRKKWNKMLSEALATWKAIFNFDRLYLGGGQTKKINFPLPDNVTIVSNELGLIGGAALWRDE